MKLLFPHRKYNLYNFLRVLIFSSYWKISKEKFLKGGNIFLTGLLDWHIVRCGVFSSFLGIMRSILDYDFAGR